jgi:hypothetical protein
MSRTVFATQLLPLEIRQGSITVRGNEIVESLVSNGSLNVAFKIIVLLGDARPSEVV